MSKTLIPAYGREYTSAKAVKQDWEAGKDFLIADNFDPYDGKPINRDGAITAGIRRVGIRYQGLTKQTFIDVPAAVTDEA